MSTAANKAIMRRYWLEAWNGQRLDRFDQLMEASYAAEEKHFVKVLWRAFPDMHFAIEELIAEADAVVSRLTWSGTHLGEYEGIAPTGKWVTITGLALHHVVHGRIVRDGQMSQLDWLSFYRQLGSMPD